MVKLAYGEKKLEVAVALLQGIDGFEIAEETLFIP